MCIDFEGHHSGGSSFDYVIRCGPYPQVPVRFKKKKKSGQESSIWSRVPETGSDPPIGSDRDSGRDRKRGVNQNGVVWITKTRCKIFAMHSNFRYDSENSL